MDLIRQEYDITGSLPSAYSELVFQSARHRFSEEEVVIKIFQKCYPRNEKLARNEIQVMRQLQLHPNIARLLHVCETHQEICLVFEKHFCQLNEYLRGNTCDFELNAFMGQLLQVLHYIHSQGYLLGNLKPQSVVVSNDKKKILLTNFECCVKVDEPIDGELAAAKDPYFEAPELADGQLRFHTQKSDLWSMGVLFYLMACGKMPFACSSKSTTFENIQEGRYDDSILLSSQSKAMVHLLLEKDAAKRATAKQLLDQFYPDVSTEVPSQVLIPDMECVTRVADRFEKSNTFVTQRLYLPDCYDSICVAYWLLVSRKARGEQLSALRAALTGSIDGSLSTRSSEVELLLEDERRYPTPVDDDRGSLDDSDCGIYETRAVGQVKKSRSVVENVLHSVALIAQSMTKPSNHAFALDNPNYVAASSADRDFLLPGGASYHFAERSPRKREYSGYDSRAGSPSPPKKGSFAQRSRSLNAGSGNRIRVQFPANQVRPALIDRSNEFGPNMNHCFRRPRTPTKGGFDRVPSSKTSGKARKMFSSLERGVDRMRQVIGLKRKESLMQHYPEVVEHNEANIVYTNSSNPRQVIKSLKDNIEALHLHCSCNNWTVRGKTVDASGRSCLLIEVELVWSERIGKVGLRRNKWNNDAALYRDVCAQLVPEKQLLC